MSNPFWPDLIIHMGVPRFANEAYTRIDMNGFDFGTKHKSHSLRSKRERQCNPHGMEAPLPIRIAFVNPASAQARRRLEGVCTTILSKVKPYQNDSQAYNNTRLNTKTLHDNVNNH
jgi:hypothetical protein